MVSRVVFPAPVGIERFLFTFLLYFGAQRFFRPFHPANESWDVFHMDRVIIPVNFRISNVRLDKIRASKNSKSGHVLLARVIRVSNAYGVTLLHFPDHAQSRIFRRILRYTVEKGEIHGAVLQEIVKSINSFPVKTAGRGNNRQFRVGYRLQERPVVIGTTRYFENRYLLPDAHLHGEFIKRRNNGKQIF